MFFVLACETEKETAVYFEIESLFESVSDPEATIGKAIYSIAITYESDLLTPESRTKLSTLLDSNGEILIEELLDLSVLKATSEELALFQKKRSALVYKEKQYEPIIYVPNKQTANFDLSPIIAIGAEIDYTRSDLVGDVIVGWYYDDNNEKQIVYLDETISLNNERPVLIVTDGEKFIPSQSIKTGVPVLKSGHQELGTPAPIIDEYKITHRYESRGKSDYNKRLIYTYENGGTQEGVRDKIRSIHKDDIGRIFYDDYEIWEFGAISNLARGYVVTYERDWSKGKKVITWQDGLSWQCARMSSSSEWYQKFWVDYENGGSPELYPDSNGYVYSKGHVKIKY